MYASASQDAYYFFRQFACLLPTFSLRDPWKILVTAILAGETQFKNTQLSRVLLPCAFFNLPKISQTNDLIVPSFLIALEIFSRGRNVSCCMLSNPFLVWASLTWLFPQYMRGLRRLTPSKLEASLTQQEFEPRSLDSWPDIQPATLALP